MQFHVNHMELASIGNFDICNIHSSADAPNRRPLLEIYLKDIGFLQRNEWGGFLLKKDQWMPISGRLGRARRGHTEADQGDAEPMKRDEISRGF